MGKRKQLDARQLKAIALLVSQDVNGLTKEQIAEQVGVSVVTLWTWRKDRTFNDELVKQAEEMQRTFLADTYNSLRYIISSNKVKDTTKLKAIELMLRNQGRLKDVQEQQVTIEERSVEDMLSQLDKM